MTTHPLSLTGIGVGEHLVAANNQTVPYATYRPALSKLVVVVAGLLLLIAPRGFCALNFTMSESVVDRVVTNRDAGGAVFYELRTTNSGSFKAVLTIPGLTATNLTTNTPLQIDLGGWSFSSTLGAADARTAASWTFILTAPDADTGRDTETGRLSLTRTGATATITGTFRQLEASFLAGDFVGLAGPVAGLTLAAVRLGENDFERTLFYKGTSTATNRQFGTGGGTAEFPINVVQLTGATDDTRPTLSITSPKTGLRSSNDFITVRGGATDSIGVRDVQVRVNDRLWQSAPFFAASNSWFLEIALDPGTNFIRAFSVDWEGNPSATSVVQVLYVFPLSLTIEPANGGTVAGVAHQQMLVPGANYRATATAKAGLLFDGWSGDYTQTTAGLNFMMTTERVLQANFVPNLFPARAGAYNGLFLGTTNSAATNSGFVSLNLTATGFFTGKLLMEGREHRFTGQFSPRGNAQVIVLRSNDTPVSMTANLNADDSETISGTVSNEFWTSALRVEHLLRVGAGQYFFGRGRYTMLIIGEGDVAIRPVGDGPATLTVDSYGSIKMSGSVADGSPITQGWFYRTRPSISKVGIA